MVLPKPWLWNLWSTPPEKQAGHSMGTPLWSTSALHPKLHNLATVFKIAPPCDWSGTCPHGVVARQLNISKRVKQRVKCRLSQVILVLVSQRKPRMFCSTGLYWSWCFIFGKWFTSPTVSQWCTHVEFTKIPHDFGRIYLLLRSLHFYVWRVWKFSSKHFLKLDESKVKSFEAALFMQFSPETDGKMQQLVYSPLVIWATKEPSISSHTSWLVCFGLHRLLRDDLIRSKKTNQAGRVHYYDP